MYCLYNTLDNIMTLCYNMNRKRGVDMECDSKYIMGRLGYNSENDRYGLLVSDLWEHDGFHCGEGFMRIVTNWRLLVLILIVTGFWMVQQQLYATMPKYVIRLAGETAKPGWIANVNPFVVVCCVSFITRLMAKRSAITSMNVGMFLIPVSALLMACGNILGNDIISGMSNITLMMVAGIVVQALAECFISPRYLEYFSLQAPRGEEGMYLGFSHLHSFLSSIFGFGLAGILQIEGNGNP